MPHLSRRTALATIAVGAVGVVAGAAVSIPLFAARSPILTRPVPRDTPAPSGPAQPPRPRPVRTGSNPVAAENRRPGSAGWRIGDAGTRPADDVRMQITGYASRPSVPVGESIDFHVTAIPNADFTIAVYRLGHYRGAGARQLTTSPTLRGRRQAAPTLDQATGMISCGWDPVWTLDIPQDWVSGAYLAVFTSDSGWRSVTPFVVRDDNRHSDLCVVLPFSTYQAYNQWPADDSLGRSLYYGYDPRDRASGRLSSKHRAVKVSFDRPYANGGLPNRFDRDHDFIRWVEESGYDVTYATSTDLHTGAVDPSKFAGLIFCGHDEYWSHSMRAAAEKAVAHGTGLAFMSANNLYWQVRFEPSAGGRDNRVMVCYKFDPDPWPDTGARTVRWRDIHKLSAEQGLLGVQYNGIIARPEPLVVRAADHWFWAGSGVRDGDRIGRIVAGEADGLDPRAPRPSGVTQTLLSATPYRTRYDTKQIQNTSVYETPQGGLVFVAATLDWARGLSRPGHRDDRIRTATANLVRRMLEW